MVDGFVERDVPFLDAAVVGRHIAAIGKRQPEDTHHGAIKQPLQRVHHTGAVHVYTRLCEVAYRPACPDEGTYYYFFVIYQLRKDIGKEWDAVDFDCPVGRWQNTMKEDVENFAR